MIDDLLYTSQMTFHNEKKKGPLQSHFLDNEYKEMKPKPNVMETTSFSAGHERISQISILVLTVK